MDGAGSLPSEKLLSSEDTPRFDGEWHDEGPFHRNVRRTKRYFVWLGSILGLSLFINAVMLIESMRHVDLDALAIRRSQLNWSPIMNDNVVKYKTVLFDSTLFSSSVYREDASDEVDQAWMDLGLTTNHIVDEVEVNRIGYTPGMVKQAEADGGGYFGQMEVFHQLHCLDTLRQGLYFNYDYYHNNRKGIWERSDRIVRYHMGHCLDALRMQLQCSADLGLLGFVWINGSDIPFAQFSTEHKCRDFDAIRDWALKHDQKGAPERRQGDIVLDEYP